MAERLMLEVRVLDGIGCLVAADGYTRDEMKSRGYRLGDVLSADLKKPRSVGFHRLAHAFGNLCAQNIEAFFGLSAHAVLKRLQLESNTECENVRISMGGEMVDYRIPKSLSFASMEQGEFEQVIKALCRYVAATYWQTLTEDQVLEMAEMMPQ